MSAIFRASCKGVPFRYSLQRCDCFVHSFLLPISGNGVTICDPLIIFSTLAFVNILQGVTVLVTPLLLCTSKYTPFYGLTFRTIPASLHHFCQSLFKVLEMLGYFFTCNLDIYQHPAAVRLPLVTVSGRAAALFVVLERCNAESVFSLVSIRDPQRLPLSFRSGTLRTLVIVSERSHFSTSLRLQQLSVHACYRVH